MLRIVYLLFAVVVLGAYAYTGFRGLEPTRQRKAFTPAGKSMRGAHGGSRTFWYGGYRGGK